MRVNRTNFIANRAMRKKGNTKNRFEQVLAANLIKYHLKDYTTVETEYKLKGLVPIGDDDFTGNKAPQPDIFIQYFNKRIIIRVNGPYHDSRTDYDWVQKEFLERQPNPYTVVDFNHDVMPTLFATHIKRPTIEECVTVYSEIYTQISWLLPIPLYPNPDLIKHILEKI